MGLFSKTLTLGGARTPCSIPENHKTPVLYLSLFYQSGSFSITVSDVWIYRQRLNSRQCFAASEGISLSF